ncbi:unnamed protein product [Rhizoctonia solani]|uniref:Uncharacterized protein n=1 Tax=Rhizoctonia solani TaxID=456999 RepID=A0A8H3C5D3_9AGAM|nr:unnamed protein product [Rhizoctonia solani]
MRSNVVAVALVSSIASTHDTFLGRKLGLELACIGVVYVWLSLFPMCVDGRNTESPVLAQTQIRLGEYIDLQPTRKECQVQYLGMQTCSAAGIKYQSSSPRYMYLGFRTNDSPGPRLTETYHERSSAVNLTFPILQPHLGSASDFMTKGYELAVAVAGFMRYRNP